MADELGERDALLGKAAHCELVEHAGGPVWLDQAVDRQQGGEQGRHPERAAAGSGEQRPVRPDRERKQGRHQQEEEQRQQGRAARRRKPKLAQDKRGHASATVFAPSRAKGWWVAARIAPPAARCAAIAASRRARPSESSPLAGSSSSHKGAPLATTRASAARFFCPVESILTRTLAEVGDSHRLHARVDVVDPEGERGAERLPLVQRRVLVGERRLGPIDRARGGPQKAGGEADQRRLAGPVRPGDQSRLAGRERKAHPLEQQPPAADAGDPLEREKAHPACSSMACMSASEKPK